MDATKQFVRKIEDFTCEHCGHLTSGNGYTNHCPKCLWSKHVDNNPGDRASGCGGMMEPVTVNSKDGGYDIKHRCLKCGHEKNNKIAQGDDFDRILEVGS